MKTVKNNPMKNIDIDVPAQPFRRSILILCLTFMTSMGFSQKQPEYKALIITGQNNHGWQTSSSIIEQAFDQSKLFTANLSVSPPKGADMKDFKPEFKKYDVICLDYNGDPWPEKTQKKFEKFVRKGGGVVLFHAADNSFPEWEAYNTIIGLGGWNGRTEENGPYVYWKNGEVIRDNSPGNGGSHGQQEEYIVITRKSDHPIMKGLPDEWLHAKDELYNRLRGPAENMEILATAEQDTARGGTSRQEPILFTITYGKGKIFHSVMGHADKNYYDPVRCEGFLTTLLRGAEWVISGEVTQPVPSNFPSPSEVRIREKLLPGLIE